MKNKVFYIFCVFILSYNNNYSQEQSQVIDESDWSNIINYVAGKITDLYIQEYLGKTSNENIEAEKGSYLEFKEELGYNSIDQPINPETLQNFLNSEFSRTNEKLTTRILFWKNLEPKNLNILFDSLPNLLVDLKSDIQNIPEYSALKTEIRASYYNEVKEVQKEVIGTNSGLNNEDSEQGSLWNNLLLFQVLTGVFFLTTIIFLLVWLDIRSKYREKKKELKKINKEKSSFNSLQPKTTSTTYRHPSRKKVEKIVKKEIPSPDPSSRAAKNTQEIDSTQENREQTNYIPQPPAEVESTPKLFYTGKPTPQREFQELKNDKEEKHIYKLTLLDDITAEFELMDLSSYMKTEVINSPDDYLYRVCHHENENTEFTNEIVTIRKGTANKVDGIWQVNEENKAIIKFQ